MYKRQDEHEAGEPCGQTEQIDERVELLLPEVAEAGEEEVCLLYTSDAADERSSVDLGGRRIIQKKKISLT